MTQGKLLIVDDELSVRDSLAKWFTEEGYEVATAENANEALTRVAEQTFDLALVDIKMRGTDGIELQRRLHEIHTDMLVIIMTGYASVETAIAALKNGAYDYVNKPLDPDEIGHLIAKAMSHRRTEQENTRLKETVAEIAHPSDIIGSLTITTRGAVLLSAARKSRPRSSPIPIVWKYPGDTTLVKVDRPCPVAVSASPSSSTILVDATWNGPSRPSAAETTP